MRAVAREVLAGGELEHAEHASRRSRRRARASPPPHEQPDDDRDEPREDRDLRHRHAAERVRRPLADRPSVRSAGLRALLARPACLTSARDSRRCERHRARCALSGLRALARASLRVLGGHRVGEDTPRGDPVAALATTALECRRMNGQKPLELILARNLLSSISTPAFLVGEEGRCCSTTRRRRRCSGGGFEETRLDARREWTAEFGPFDGDDCRSPTTRSRRRSPCATTGRITALPDPRRPRRPSRRRGERDPDRRASAARPARS